MNGWRVIEADCVEAMAAMPEASVDAVVTDPPYGLGFMGAQWDTFDPATMGERVGTRVGNGPPSDVRDGRHKGRSASAFANPGGEAGSYDFTPAGQRRFHDWTMEWAAEALRVLKPGGHLLAFGGTRTYHRLVCAVEDAGFEIRDTIAYMYGSGFPKSLNLDRLRGETFCGCGDGEQATEHDMRAVRGGDVPAPISASRGEGSLLLPGLPQPGAPVEGREELPTAEARRGESGVEGRRHAQAREGQLHGRPLREGANMGASDGTSGRLRDGAPAGDGDADRAPARADGSGASPRPESREQQADEPRTVADERLAQDGRGWPCCDRCGLPIVPRGLGTALKPAHEPIVVARKPLAGTVAGNVLAHGTGALNVDGCRIEGPPSIGGGKRGAASLGLMNDDGWEPKPGEIDRELASGRWPANVVLDEEAGAMLDTQTGELPAGVAVNRNREPNTMSSWMGTRASQVGDDVGYGDSGGASRFFYCAKASRRERNAGLDGFKAMGGGSLNVAEHGDTRVGRVRSDGAVQQRSKLTPRANTHPTVKPIELMRWLVRLVTPPGGVVLDPFTGSGTTGCAATLEGFRFYGIEREAEYAEIARARIAWWASHPGGPARRRTDAAVGQMSLGQQ